MNEKIQNEQLSQEIFTDLIQKEFQIKEIDAGSYSPLVLAFIGDSVYELIIRTIVVGQGNSSVNRLNRRSSSFAKASAQAAIIKCLMEELTPEEMHVFKRGRNAKSVTVAKNATMMDYRMATGLEALVGYLYLSGQYKRLVELVKSGMEQFQIQKNLKE